MFFSPFSIAITSLGKERATLSAFRTFVWFALVWFCLFPFPLDVWEGLRFVIVALPGLFSYLFCRTCFSNGRFRGARFRPSVYSSVRPFVFPSTFTLDVLWAPPLTVLYRSFWNCACVFVLVWRCACGLNITVLYWLFWNFACVFFMVWECACGLDKIVRTFLSFFFYIVDLVFFHPQYIDSRYLLWAQLLLQFYTDWFGTLYVYYSWYENVHVVWVKLFEHFLSFFHTVNLVFFHPQYIDNGYLVSTTPLTVLYRSFWNFAYFYSWYENVHVVLV